MHRGRGGALKGAVHHGIPHQHDSAWKGGVCGMCGLRTWHVLFLVGLLVQLVVFHRYEQTVKCRMDMSTAADRHGMQGERERLKGAERSSLLNSSMALEGEDSEEAASRQRQQLLDASGPPVLNIKTFSKCKLEQVGGRAKDNYGAWTLCTDHLKKGGIVYSFGIGADVSFDNDMVHRGMKVFGFDPTVPPSKVASMFQHNHKRKQPPSFKYQQLGLSASDGVISFFKSKNPRVQSMTAVDPDSLSANYKNDGFQAAVLRLRTFMCMNGHNFIDVLKMDVEGVEFDVCNSADWIESIPAGQVLIEFHERMVKGGVDKKAKCFKNLEKHGFRAVHVSKNKQETAFARITKNAKIESAQSH